MQIDDEQLYILSGTQEDTMADFITVLTEVLRIL